MAKRRSRGEGTVFYREDKNLWTAVLTLPDGKKRYKYARSQKEAREWLLQERKALQDGIVVDDQHLTVGQFIDRWLEDVKVPVLRPSTLESHRSLIRNHIKPELGHIRLRGLSPAHLQNLYTTRLKAGLSKKTVRTIHMILHQTLDQALKWGLVSRNVADAVSSPSPDRKAVEPLTKEQVARLLAVLKTDRLFALYVVYLGCGLRRGEALALTWDCVDLENGMIHVKKTIQLIPGKGLVTGEPKSEKSRRSIAMPDYVREALVQHQTNQLVPSDYVFATSRGTPFNPRNIVRHFKSALRRAGLPPTMRIHDLRHTFVSWLLAQNTPPKDVQEIVGHSSFGVTMDIYGHLMPGAYREAAKRMESLFE